MSRKLFVSLALLPGLMTATATSHAAEQTLWQEGIDYVAVSDENVPQPNNHPFNLPADKLARILSQLKIRSADEDNVLTVSSAGNPPERVFTDREIDLLAQSVSKALAQADSTQAVLFSVSDLRSQYLGDKRLSVSGTAFVRDHQLNLLFGEIHVDLQKKYLRSGASVSNSRFASKAELAKFRLDTGSSNTPGKHDWQLQSFAGAQSVDARQDWLQIDLQQTFDYVKAAKDQEAHQEKYLSASQKAEADAIEERLSRLEAAVETAPSGSGDDSLENRLRKLKQLYQDGVIPESVYLKKVDSIMQEL